MENQQQNANSPEGYKPAPADYFSGHAWLKALVVPDENTNFSVTDVMFEPGVRNNWHQHPSNQILIIKEGICFYQEDGKPVRLLQPGEVVNVLPGIKHWHGASPDAKMIHTAINLNSEKGPVKWLEQVSDEQYHG